MAYRRLSVLVELGVLNRVRLLYGQPALFTASRERLAWAGLPTVDPARVGVATVRHWATCARLAVALERCDRVRVWGEPRLRAAERDSGEPIASAELGVTGDGRRRLRRPDLVLFSLGARSGLPVAVEGRAVGEGRAAVGGDLPGVGPLPARRGGSLLRAADGGARGFRCRFLRRTPRERRCSLEDALGTEEVTGDGRLAA